MLFSRSLWGHKYTRYNTVAWVICRKNTCQGNHATCWESPTACTHVSSMIITQGSISFITNQSRTSLLNSPGSDFYFLSKASCRNCWWSASGCIRDFSTGWTFRLVGWALLKKQSTKTRTKKKCAPHHGALWCGASSSLGCSFTPSVTMVTVPLAQGVKQVNMECKLPLQGHFHPLPLAVTGYVSRAREMGTGGYQHSSCNEGIHFFLVFWIILATYFQLRTLITILISVSSATINLHKERLKKDP